MLTFVEVDFALDDLLEVLVGAEAAGEDSEQLFTLNLLGEADETQVVKPAEEVEFYSRDHAESHPHDHGMVIFAGLQVSD